MAINKTEWHKMKKKWYKIAYRSLSALLVLLGFESCGSGDSPVEYGTPTVDFHIVGQVTDEAGQPIEGIRVTARGYYAYTDGSTETTTQTDKNGYYKTADIKTGWIEPELKVVFEDVDGTANGGTFKKDSVMSDAMQRRQVKRGDGNWYQGEYELTANKTLPTSKTDGDEG